MANIGNQGTSPYSKVVLDNTVQAGSDTPYPVSFVGDAQTGLFYKGAGNFGFGVNGVEVGSFKGPTFTSTFVAESVAINLTATGTGTAAAALQLTSAYNFIGLAASMAGAILPAGTSVQVGGSVCVFNDGAGKMQIFGNGSDTIDGNAAATGVTLSNTKRCMFILKATATWISTQFGAVSS